MTGQALSRLSWTSASHPRLRPCVNADRRALSGTKVRTLGTRVRDLRLFRPLLLTSVPGPGVTVVRPDGYIGFRAPRRPASSPPGSPASMRSANVAEDGAGHLVDGRGDERGQAGAWVRSAASIACTMSRQGIRSSASASRIASSRPNPCELAVRVSPARADPARTGAPGLGGADGRGRRRPRRRAPPWSRPRSAGWARRR